MPFEEGHKKAKGRIKGSVNKDSEYKLFLKKFLDTGKEKLILEINKLEGLPYINSTLAIMEYVLPKLARVEVKDESETTQNITINYTKQK